MICVSYIYNLFCSDKKFACKMVTIRKYHAMVPHEERLPAKTFEEEYKNAVAFVGKEPSEKSALDREDFFRTLSSDEIIIAITIGVLAYTVAVEIDRNGTTIEKAIDKVLPKDYDKNNPFDTKAGYGHRLFGHDPFTFGIKNIDGDLLIRVKNATTGKHELVKIGDYLGTGVNTKVSMWDLIWKYYGNDDSVFTGVTNCFKHIIVHFAKDLLTPAGLPIPFTTLLNKYEYNEYAQAHISRYKGSVTQRLDKLHLRVKASDIASLAFIELMTDFYCITKGNEQYTHGFKEDVKLFALGTCISLQMMTIIVGDSIRLANRECRRETPGANINLALSVEFIKTMKKEIEAVVSARSDVNKGYRRIKG